MSPSLIRVKVVVDRAAYVRRMMRLVHALPLESERAFEADPRTAAAAESYLRRAIEAVLDLGRHVLAKGFGVASPEYKTIASGLQEAGVLNHEQSARLREIAGYRNRLTHFYAEVGVSELYEICTEHVTEVEELLGIIEGWCRDHPDRLDGRL